MHILIVHDHDQDGYCAAAIAKHRYNNLSTIEDISEDDYKVKDIKIDTATVNDDIDWDNCHADTVVFLDHTPSESRVKALLAADKEVLILDHHPETEELFIVNMGQNNLIVCYDENMSTAKIAWNHFFGDTKDIPFTVTMIDKWDSWNHDEENILPFHYGMACMDLKDDALWNALLFEEGRAQAEMQIIAMGNAVGQFWLARLNEITEPTSWCVTKDGVKYSVCNTQLTSSYDLMTHIKTNSCQGAVWFYNVNNGTANTWMVVIKVLPDEDRKQSSRKELLTIEQLTESWLQKDA